MNEVFTALFPGMMYFWVFFIGQTPMQEVLYEKESRTLQRLLAAPVTFNEFLLSKLLRCFVLCGLVQVCLIILSTLLLGVKWGNPVYLAGVIVIGTLAITGVLALIYSLARTKEQANTISSLVLLVFALVGGSMFPYESLPRFLQMIGSFSPNRWGILAIQDVMQAKPWRDLIMPLLILAAIGLVGTLSAIPLFRRQLIGGASS